MNADWEFLKRCSTTDEFKHLPVVASLINYGYDVLYKSRSAAGHPLLAFHAEEIKAPQYASRHVVASTNPETLAALEAGWLSIYDALTRAWMWVVDVDSERQVSAAWSIEPRQLPADTLPSPTTMLSPELEPAITLRFTGKALREGAVPASVLRAAGDSVQSALRKLTDFLADRGGSGRRESQHRALYNLAAQRIAFGSLEIAFSRPQPLPTQTGDVPLFGVDETLESRMWEMLRSGLQWIGSEGPLSDLVASGPDERLAILSALEKLTPATDLVDEVQVGGSELQRTQATYNLTKASRRRVQRSKSELEGILSTYEEDWIASGLVRALDLEKRNFYLRTPQQVANGDEGGILFELVEDEDVTLADEVNNGHVPVVVTGRRRMKGEIPATEWQVADLRLGTLKTPEPVRNLTPSET